jgi:hypothetical protein
MSEPKKFDYQVFHYNNKQFSTGDQSNESRIKFYNNDCEKCIHCDSKEIDKEHVIANCRMNGDAYGTDVFSCTKCGWYTSFHWDDASEYDYYEVYEFCYFGNLTIVKK